MMSKRFLSAAAWAVLLLAAGISRVGAQAAYQVLYELYNSTSTSSDDKRILKHIIWMQEKRYLGPTSGGVGPLQAGARAAVPAVRARIDIDGGSVRRADGASVGVPADALQEAVDITISRPIHDGPSEVARQQKRDGDRLVAASDEVEYGPDGLAFIRPVTIKIPYSPEKVADQGLSEKNLKIHHWNSRMETWEPLASVVDARERTVRAQTAHFSIYQILSSGGGIGVAAADAALGFKSVYAFPNPVHGQGTVTIRVQPGLADFIEVRVYDLAGRKAHASSSFNNLGAFDDGNGLGPQFTFDHAWDVSGVGSGVYRYVVTAKKMGQTDIVKTGKLAVVK